MAPLQEAVLEAISGGIGSVLALLATYPLKTIYTHQALSANNSAAMSVLDIIAKYKLSGLYVGIEPNIIESGASSAVYFYLYSKLRAIAVRSRQQRLQRQQGGASQAEPLQGAAAGGSTKNQDIGVLASLLVAAIAGAGNQLVTMPLSVVATRMQAKQKQLVESGGSGSGPGAQQSAGAFSVIADVWRESGPAGFWAGLLPALVLVVNPAVQYMLYEQFLRLLRRWKAAVQAAKQQQQQQQGQGDEGAAAKPPSSSASSQQQPKPVSLSALEIFLASAAAKIGATVFTYPMIVVKSRMQAASKSKSVHDSQQYHGTLHAITRTFQDEGVGGFFKGLRAKILQTALNAALMLMLKEQCYTLTFTAMSRASLSGLPAGAAANLVK